MRKLIEGAKKIKKNSPGLKLVPSKKDAVNGKSMASMLFALSDLDEEKIKSVHKEK